MLGLRGSEGSPTKIIANSMINVIIIMIIMIIVIIMIRGSEGSPTKIIANIMARNVHRNMFNTFAIYLFKEKYTSFDLVDMQTTYPKRQSRDDR